MSYTTKFEFWFGLILGIAVAWNVYAMLDPWTPHDPGSHHNFLQSAIGWVVLWAVLTTAWCRQRRLHCTTPRLNEQSSVTNPAVAADAKQSESAG